MVHRQIFRSSGLMFVPVSKTYHNIKVNGRVVNESLNIAVDKFYDEKHNLRDGFINTSPDVFDDPQFASHAVALPPASNRCQGMTDKEIFETSISRKVQSPCEVSKLRSLRPAEPVKEDPAPVADPEPNAA